MNQSKNGNKLNTKDNLSLDSISIPKLPTDILFPQELNQYLRDHIQTLSQENQFLKNNLKEKDVEISKSKTRIENLQGKIKQYEHYTNLGSNNKLSASQADLATSKIIELSKKNRELTSELESYRTKCIRLENKIKELTFEPPSPKQNTEEKKPEDPSQVKVLSDKLAATTKKLHEIKNQNIALTNELKQANKLLSQEIGESFTSISNLTQNGSNWRGRAQQIIKLEQKLSEYQDKLCPIERESTNTAALKQIESNKRLIQEQLTKELGETKSQLEETKKRLEGSKARSKILENDVTNIKTKMNTLINKSEHDDQLIKALTNEININESKYQDKLKSTEGKYEKLLEEYNALKVELKINAEKEIELKKIITEKEDKIHELKIQIRESYQNGVTPIKPTDQNESSNLKLQQEQKAIFRAADSERLRLLDLVSVLNNNLDEIKQQLDETRLELKKEKQKVRKLEEKLVKLETIQTLPRGYARNSLKSNSTISEKSDDSNDFKNKLELAEEKILLLQTRIDTLEEEKRIHIENFNLMLENTRQIFREELTQINSKK